MDSRSIAALCIGILILLFPFGMFLSHDWVREDLKRIYKNKKWRRNRG